MTDKKAYYREYYEKNKEKCKKKMQRYGIAHREELTERHRAYYEKNKERIEENRKIWRKKKRIEVLREEIPALYQSIEAMHLKIKETAASDFVSYDAITDTIKKAEKAEKLVKSKETALNRLLAEINSVS